MGFVSVLLSRRLNKERLNNFINLYNFNPREEYLIFKPDCFSGLLVFRFSVVLTFSDLSVTFNDLLGVPLQTLRLGYDRASVFDYGTIN